MAKAAEQRTQLRDLSVEDLRTMQRATDAWVTRFRAAIAAGTACSCTGVGFV